MKVELTSEEKHTLYAVLEAHIEYCEEGMERATPNARRFLMERIPYLRNLLEKLGSADNA